MAAGKVTGLKEVKAGLRKGVRRFERAAGLALHDLGEVIFDKSQKDVPMQPMSLRESRPDRVDGEALIETAVFAPHDVEGAIGTAVSYDSPYAVKIEKSREFDAARQERLARATTEANVVPDGAVGGKSHFLTDAFTEAVGKAFPELAAGTKKAFDTDDKRPRKLKRGKRRSDL
jgi:hypothetical protein